VSHQTSFVVLDSAIIAQDLLVNSSFPNQGMTVTRIIASFTFVPEVDEASGDAVVLHFGIVPMSTDAAIAGAFEDPDTPEQTDWLLLDHVYVRNPSASAAVWESRQYNLGGQRKFGNMDSSVYFVIKSAPINLTMDTLVFMTTRVLLKMP